VTWWRLRAETAWVRLQADIAGWSAGVLVGALMAAGVTMLAALCLTAAPGASGQRVVQRAAGLEAIPVTWSDGKAWTPAELTTLIADPRVAISCRQAMRLTTPVGLPVDLTMLTGTPAALDAVNVPVQWGRALTWQDTIGPVVPVLTGAGVSGVAGWRGLLRGPGHESPTLSGVWETSDGHPVHRMIATLLRPATLGRVCAPPAVVEVAFVGDASLLGRDLSVLTTHLRPADIALGAPTHVRVTAAVPALLMRRFNAAVSLGRGVLAGALLVYGGSAGLALVLVLAMRAEGRRGDLAVCRAVGATRHAVVAELVLESAVLGGMGGLTGAGVAGILLVVIAPSVVPTGMLVAVATSAVVIVVSCAVAVALWAVHDAVRHAPYTLLAGARW